MSGSEPQHPQTLVRSPELANVMGYAEYPFIEVVRIATKHNMHDLAAQTLAAANKATAIAAREWTASLEGQIAAATGESINAPILGEKIAALKANAEATKEPEAPLVIPETNNDFAAKVIAVLVNAGPEDIMSHTGIVNLLGSNPSVVHRVTQGLTSLGLAQKGIVRGSGPGRPQVPFYATKELKELVDNTPSLRNASEFWKIQRKFGWTETQTMAYLTVLGKHSLAAIE